jgi:hypothetical protein
MAMMRSSPTTKAVGGLSTAILAVITGLIVHAQTGAEDDRRAAGYQECVASGVAERHCVDIWQQW